MSIHAVERFLGDMATAEGWTIPTAPATGKRVLVVGAGPSGLSAAYHLTRLGHQVEIHEAGPLPGGMLHFGIPAYRLPRADLLAEIARIERMGVRIVLNRKVDRRARRARRGRVRRGVHRDRRACRQARRHPGARRGARAGRGGAAARHRAPATQPLLGRRVVVYGGGNTAMDAARTARRLGAEEALIVYRRDRAHMPAHEFEADEALAEGVKIKWLTTIKDIVGADAHGRADDDRRQGPAAADRRDWRRWRRTPSCWRSARTPTATSCAACPASNSNGTRWWSTGR